MGYYTRHSISIQSNDHAILSMLLEKLNKFTPYTFELDGDRIVSDEPIKWYESTDDLKAISGTIDFQDRLIVVDCEGEDSALWRDYFLNGRFESVEPQIIFPETTLKADNNK